MVTSWLCGFFVKSPCLALNRKTPAGPGCCLEFFFPLYIQIERIFFVVFAGGPHPLLAKKPLS